MLQLIALKTRADARWSIKAKSAEMSNCGTFFSARWLRFPSLSEECKITTTGTVCNTLVIAESPHVRRAMRRLQVLEQRKVGSGARQQGLPLQVLLSED